MPTLSTPTLQKRHGGRWIALSPKRGKVYAASKSFTGLLRKLEKKEIKTKKVIFKKVDHPDSPRAY